MMILLESATNGIFWCSTPIFKHVPILVKSTVMLHLWRHLAGRQTGKIIILKNSIGCDLVSMLRGRNISNNQHSPGLRGSVGLVPYSHSIHMRRRQTSPYHKIKEKGTGTSDGRFQY